MDESHPNAQLENNKKHTAHHFIDFILPVLLLFINSRSTKVRRELPGGLLPVFISKIRFSLFPFRLSPMPSAKPAPQRALPFYIEVIDR
jgi:hypothetical protein